MSKLHRQSGQNIRDLAVTRRLKAIYLFISAGLVAIFPFFLVASVNNFLKHLPSLNSPQIPIPAIKLPIIVYILFIFIALGLILNGIYFWQRANQADQGAEAEEDIAKLLVPLHQEGWHIEYR
ncbi:hypothetical protein H6G76_31480 [Nostoc sp. FACHB-152]|uniref:hypothetical protein n=1 Tax=unclassified Nostoc TaxID=2593658 RepID=UPI001684D8C4|nr:MULTISPECIES: hypothetical protein [unclassified Nostoc]MBD2451561.1 hypothetical protein [Nostoc sp. FACHB-152]MBD2466408.1 hypothetical protein [Nostoc sp. FACHB-145]